jgi:excisionase family DNA binding protein
MANDSRLSPLLRVSEVALLLHVHINTVRRWSDCGWIPAYRINPHGHRRFKLEDVTRFLAESSPYKGNGEKDRQIR